VSAVPTLSFDLQMRGLLKNSFGVSVLNLHGLQFGAGFIATPPYINELKIAGGLCLGTAKACKTHFKGAFTAAQASLVSKIKDGPVKFGSKRALELGWDENWLDSTGASPKLVEVDAFGKQKTHTVVFKVAVGFNVKAASFYFYASMSQTTLQNLVSAVGSSVQMPSAIGDIEISGFGKETTAYISFATRDEEIKALSKAGSLKGPLKIPMGLSVSGSLKIFGKKTGLKINIQPKEGKFSGTLVLPPIKLSGFEMCYSKAQPAKGITMSVNIDIPARKFEGSLHAFIKLGFLGSAGIQLKLSSTGMLGIFSINFFNIFEAEVQIQSGMEQKSEEELIQGENSMVTSEGYHTAFEDEHQHSLLQEETGDDLTKALTAMRTGMKKSTFKFAIGLKTQKISEAINKVAKDALAPLYDAQKSVKASFAVVNGKLNQRRSEWKYKISELDDAKKSCAKSAANLRAKRNACEEEELELLRLKYRKHEAPRPQLAEARRAWQQVLTESKKFTAAEPVHPSSMSAKEAKESNKAAAEMEAVETGVEAQMEAGWWRRRRRRRRRRRVGVHCMGRASKPRQCGHCTGPGGPPQWFVAGKSTPGQWQCSGYWRCWYFGCLLKKAWVGVQWAATQVCKGAIDLLASTWKGLCTTGVDIAQGALKLAIKGLDVVQKVVNAAKSFVQAVLDKVTEWVKTLTTFVLNFVGFATSGFGQAGSQFGFIAKLTLNGTPKEYKWNHTLGKGETIWRLALSIFAASIKKAFTDAINWIKNKAKSLFSIMEVEDLEELQDMDAKSRAAAKQNSLSLDQFINPAPVRSTALAQGSFKKKKQTQILVRAGGRDYVMKIPFSSFTEMVSKWESQPLGDHNAHWHYFKRSEKKHRDFESELQRNGLA
jgi:hypothetical protein